MTIVAAKQELIPRSVLPLIYILPSEEDLEPMQTPMQEVEVLVEVEMDVSKPVLAVQGYHSKETMGEMEINLVLAEVVVALELPVSLMEEEETVIYGFIMASIMQLEVVVGPIIIIMDWEGHP